MQYHYHHEILQPVHRPIPNNCTHPLTAQAMCQGSPTRLADSLLTVLGEAEESQTGQARVPDLVEDAWPDLALGAAVAAGHLLTTTCWGSADSENGPLTVLGEAEESRCFAITRSKTGRARVPEDM